VSLAIVFLVLFAGLIHAVWNAMAKGISSQATSFALMNVGTAIVSWIALPFTGLPREAAWPFVLASTACHLGYELFLMGSYQRANFSRAYPIARGVAPLLVSIGGLIFASEHIDLRGTFGICLIVVGIVSLAYVRNSSKLDRVGIYWALATGAAIAVYTQTRAPLGVVSALRETGVVWAAAIGVVFFKEGKARVIMVPALVVVAGIALLSLT
jgi:multidrug transporter EmrE-like cation transporter